MTPHRAGFDLLPDLLPLHAEEGPVREERKRAELELMLTQSGALSVEEARVALAILERLFDAAGLLDRRARAKEMWAFVSYPAYLLGRSIVESLAHDGAR